MHSPRAVVLACVLAPASALPAMQVADDWGLIEELAPRSGASLTYDGARDCLVLVGGRQGGAALGDHWEHDGTRWAARSTTYALEGAAMTYDARRNVVVRFGGTDGSPVPSDVTSEWDGVQWVTKNPPARPSARSHAGTVYDEARGVCVLYGGAGPTGLLGDTWEWDGTTWVQRMVTGPPASATHAMAYDARRGRTVLQIGPETHEWDGTSWSKRSTSLPLLSDMSMVFDRSLGVCLLVSPSSVRTFTWDGANWTELSPAGVKPSMRRGASLAYDDTRQRAVLFGGADFSAFRETADLWEFRSSRWRLLDEGTIPPPRNGAAMAVCSIPQIAVLFGGADLFGRLLGDTWVWGEHRWYRALTTLAPSARRGHSMVGFGWNVVLFGGENGSAYTNDMWAFSPLAQSWFPLVPSVLPPARSEHAMSASDASGQRFVLFGGKDANGLLSDTWTWDHNSGTWTHEVPAHRPPARFAHGIAFDEVSKRAILFGGTDGATKDFGDTWSWDGKDWTQLAPTRSPAARSNHAMTRGFAGRLLLFGGDGPLSDTWEWSGTDWIGRTPRVSPPSGEALLESLADHGQALLVSSRLVVREIDTWFFGPAHEARTIEVGTGCNGSGGTPALGATEATLGTPLRVELVRGRAMAPVVFGIATASQDLPVGGCRLRLAGSITFLPAGTNADGFVRAAFAIPRSAALLGQHAWIQAFVLDPAGASGIGLAFSSAVDVGIGR
ncbi:MAG: hypothetical protein H6832_07425 [Planctomycetes bacterium]|nr:hypothetical protein [Planctomycetota bacterium]